LQLRQCSHSQSRWQLRPRRPNTGTTIISTV
jgi:hypothetical protein